MKMEREYIRTKVKKLPNTLTSLKKLNNEFWKDCVFNHLLSYYQNSSSLELIEMIKKESEKAKPKVENLIAAHIRKYLRNDKNFSSDFDVFGENINDDSSVLGFYDITISNTYWLKEKDNNKEKVRFHFECKNLKNNEDLLNKYVCFNTYKIPNPFDGGVYRYFNGKYAQDQNFGGMIGFILEGDLQTIKNKLCKKLETKFDLSPEGDLKEIKHNSIEGNNFTFDSLHNRFDSEFVLHHLLFNFS